MMESGREILTGTVPSVSTLDAPSVSQVERHSGSPIPLLPVLQESRRPRGLYQSITSRMVLLALRRHWLMILIGGTALASFVGAGIWFLVLPSKLYTYAVFHIAHQAPSTNTSVSHQVAEFGSYRLSQQHYIKSSQVLSQVVNRPEVQNLPLIMDQSDPVDWLERRLQVDFKKGPESMMLYLNGDDNNSAAMLTIVQAVCTVFLEQFVNNEPNSNNEQLHELKHRKQEYEDKLNAKLGYLKTLHVKKGDVDPKDNEGRHLKLQETLRNQQQEIKTRIVQLQQEIDVTEAKLKDIKNLLIPEVDIDNELAKDPTIGQAKTTLENFKTDLAEAEKALLPGRKNDRVEQMKKDYAETLKKYQDKLSKIRSAAIIHLRDRLHRELDTKQLDDRLTLDSFRMQEAAIQTEIDRSDKTLHRLNENRENENQVQADVESIKTTLASLNTEIQNRVSKKQVVPRVSIKEEPTTSLHNERNNRLKFTVLGMIGGYASFAMGAILYEARRRRVAGIEDITKIPGLNLIGTLPEISKTKNRLLIGPPHTAPRLEALLVESIDAIQMQLLNEFKKKNLRTFMVTSAVSGEGKTSLAGQLAFSLGRAGHAVLLIDGDMRHPAAHCIFNQPLGPGLSEYLIDEVAFEKCVQKTPIEGVWFFPAGRWTPIISQRLFGSKWPELLTEVRERFDFVIVDSAPILTVADGMLLGQNVDGVLLTVMRDFSQLGLLYEAQQRLEKLQIPILGVVINGIHQELDRSRSMSVSAQKGMRNGV